jgi:hypothetical protein
VPLPEREPAAIRAAVARLDPAALARFEADWTAATSRARDEYSFSCPVLRGALVQVGCRRTLAGTRVPAPRLRANRGRVVESGGATGSCCGSQPDPAAGRDHHRMTDWTWEYVPDAANVVGGLTRPRLTRWKPRISDRRRCSGAPDRHSIRLHRSGLQRKELRRGTPRSSPAVLPLLTAVLISAKSRRKSEVAAGAFCASRGWLPARSETDDLGIAAARPETVLIVCR